MTSRNCTVTHLEPSDEECTHQPSQSKYAGMVVGHSTLKQYISSQGRQKSAEMLDYRPELLDKLAKRGAVVINGQVFAPVTKRVSRMKK